MDALFGGKPKGPDKATRAAQAKQQERLDRREAEEQKQAQARRRLITSTQRRGPVTLFSARQDASDALGA